MIAGPPGPLAWTAFHGYPCEIVPLNDLDPHVHGMSCWCGPEVDEYNTIVHQAKDRRDDYMERRRKPS